MGGGGGGSGPTVQQQQLERQQAMTTANLNLQENEQRKAILNSMMGTRVFKGSALSRAMRGNTPGGGGETTAPAPSVSQQNNASSPITTPAFDLFGIANATAGTGATPAGGAGASGRPGIGGGYAGGGSPRGGIKP